jgi:mannan endo-1,6-alpha-mannosidase
MEFLGILTLLLQLLLTTPIARAALTITPNDPNSFKQAASTAAYDMVSYYQGNQSGQIPGKLPGTWWEGGAMFMTIMQYWHWTGDDSYNDITTTGMMLQAGENYDYMPKNWSSYIVG